MNCITTKLILLALAALSARTGQAQQTIGKPPATAAGSKQADQQKDVDPNFMESTGISSTTGPQTITRNILQDSHGGFWLATWSGIIRYDGTSFVNVTNEKGLRRHRIFSLLEDHRKTIWLGTIGAGVYRYDGSTYTNITSEDGLVHDVILSIMQDNDDNIWFGSKGVTKFDGHRFTSFTAEDGFTSSDVNSISQGPDESIWFGTRGALFHYDGKSFVNFTEKHKLNISSSSYIPTLIDRSGHLWFGGEQGIFHYDGEKVRHIFPSPSFSLMEDSDGNIWFSGGAMKGESPNAGISVLNRFDPSGGLENLDERKQFKVTAGHVIFGLTEDTDGRIWYGTARGVGLIDGNTVEYFD